MATLTNPLRRTLVADYLDRVEKHSDLLPEGDPLLYDAVPGIAKAQWHLLGEELVQGELLELTNQLNHWLAHLRGWYAWNETLAQQEEEIRWGMEFEWVEPVAFRCMFQPSAARDCCGNVATAALHQVRMSIDPTVKDELLGDPKKPGKRPFVPNRQDREEQLDKLVGAWPSGKALIYALVQLDDEDYRHVTSNFRNRASHDIPRHFTVGFTSFVTRARKQATELLRQPDGTSRDMPIPDKMCTSYGYGGTPPLSMTKAWEANRQQFERARGAFDAYIALLDEVIKAMPRTVAPSTKT